MPWNEKLMRNHAIGSFVTMLEYGRYLSQARSIWMCRIV
jgi:hypothetical protein